MSNREGARLKKQQRLRVDYLVEVDAARGRQVSKISHSSLLTAKNRALPHNTQKVQSYTQGSTNLRGDLKGAEIPVPNR